MWNEQIIMMLLENGGIIDKKFKKMALIKRKNIHLKN